MATFAGIWEWFIAGKAVAAHPAHGEFRVRPLPKEDIHLFVKDFDNSRVARLVDTSDRMATFGVATTVPLVALLFIALLLPGGYNLLASRRIDQLQKEREVLVNQIRGLKAEYSALVSPRNLDEWAGTQYETPKAQAVVYAPPSKDAQAKLR